VSIEYGVVDIIDGNFPFLDGGWDTDVLSDIGRLGEGTILAIHGGGGGGSASP